MPISVETNVSDWEELGPVTYQEAKTMDNEMCLICVYDKYTGSDPHSNFLVFEVYGFETGTVTRIQ